jgi:hypothetical protein
MGKRRSCGALPCSLLLTFYLHPITLVPRALTTPRAVRHVIVYVLMNFKEAGPANKRLERTGAGRRRWAPGR